MLEYTSHAHRQAYNLAVKTIEKLERQVLAQLDALVPLDWKRASKSLIVGLCIRRLSLYYRRTMLYWKAFAGTSPLFSSNCFQ
jgi:hypothetical protein